jgi:hypothetical protein
MVLSGRGGERSQVLAGSRLVTTFCVELTSHSPPPTPLLPALTLSAGEHQVSGGEFKVSRPGALPHILLARRSKLKMAFYFWWPSRASCFCRHGGATGFLRRFYGPCRCLRDGYRIWVCRLRLFCLSCPIYSNMIPSCATSSAPGAVARMKITGDELNARAKMNGYQRGLHTETKTAVEAVISM